MGHITPDLGQDACVSAFTTVTRASDTNGSGAGQGQLDRNWTEKGWGGQDSGRGVGHGGLRARVAMRRDFTPLRQKLRGMLLPLLVNKQTQNPFRRFPQKT